MTQEWMPIESAPMDGTVIICNGGCGYKMPVYISAVFDEIDEGWFPDSYEYAGDPIHPTLWIPLPTHPKD